jgi:hypothetical protein
VARTLSSSSTDRLAKWALADALQAFALVVPRAGAAYARGAWPRQIRDRVPCRDVSRIRRDRFRIRLDRLRHTR